MTLRERIEKMVRILTKRRDHAELACNHQHSDWHHARFAELDLIIEELNEALKEDEQEGGE